MCFIFNYFLASLLIHILIVLLRPYIFLILDMPMCDTKPEFSSHDLMGWQVDFGEQKYHRFRGWCNLLELFLVLVARSDFLLSVSSLADIFLDTFGKLER